MTAFANHRHTLLRAVRAAAFVSAALLLPLAAPVRAQDGQVTMQTLLDRIQVEDFLTRYYYDLSLGKAHELSEYFTEDAVLDVDGVVAKGHAEITKLYSPSGDQRPAPQPGYRRGNMLLTNPVIDIKGDKAIAHVVWTGIMNEGVGKAPTVYEQGREDSVLVKRNGKWLLSARCITSDSGLPDRFDATWKPRENCGFK